MQTVTLADAQARLPELIDALTAEKEIVITHGSETVAVIVPKDLATSGAARPVSSIFDLKPLDLGRVLKPEFDRSEVWG